MTSYPVPNHLHFVWIGKTLPLFTRLAVQSALLACPDAQATLWHTDALESDANAQKLMAHPRFRMRALDDAALFDQSQPSPKDALLRELFATLTQPAARANLARLLLLRRHGGVYLDTDTLTLRDLSPLRAEPGFCGLELVIWPHKEVYRLSPYRLLGGHLLGLVRNACSRLPDGERWFRHLTPLYATAANNAVLGFGANHPFVEYVLDLVAEVPTVQLTRRYRLGTHLLQQALDQAGDRYRVRQLPPAYLYPLGPELSRQYFARRRDLNRALGRVIKPETFVIHWYASVSELEAFSEERIRADRDRTIFARLCSEVLGPVP